MTENTPDPLYMAKLRASLANERTNEAQAAQRLNTPKQWTEAEIAAHVIDVHGTTEARIAKLIEDANSGRI